MSGCNGNCRQGRDCDCADDLVKRLRDSPRNTAIGRLDHEAADEIERLRKQRDELVEALKYHQEQTRPIQQSIDALKKCREMVGHPDNITFIDEALTKIEGEKNGRWKRL